ncbi:MAG TPA: type II toxin-antitoxin system ParD family antitoxin [Candidatus Baltobacteraceae bacterium]|jgi:antitoxin ParD1/3/4|nr:type II toxin-antitoxin system ParD family antitoxin [Candidatus Baltobacteraceae bacterium]
MRTKNISLPEDLEAYVEAKVASGEYAHISEVVRDGIRLLMREEAAKLEWLRNAIAVGVADYKAGRTIPAAEVRAELARRRKARAEAKGRS